MSWSVACATVQFCSSLVFDSGAGQSYISNGLVTTVSVMRGLQQRQWFQ